MFQAPSSSSTNRAGPAASGSGQNPRSPWGSPAVSPGSGWHARPAWTRYARTLLRYFSRRSDYRLDVRPGQTRPLACVDHQRKVVQVTTAFPQAGPLLPAPARLVRGERRLRDAPTTFWLTGFIAHEAGHILFSSGKPVPATLGWLWNALEDERMERLVAAAYPQTAEVFDGMGDVMLSMTREELAAHKKCKKAADTRASKGQLPASGDVLGACLLWRWLHDHPGAAGGYHPHLRLPERHFAEVRPLIEAAWAAEHSDAVTEIARAILERFGISEDSAVPDGLQALDLPAGPAATGEDDGEGAAADRADADQGGTGPADSDDAKREAQGGEHSRERDPADAPPEAPEYDPGAAAAQAGQALLGGLEQAAQVLARCLRPEQQSRHRQAHRSRGRFDARRYAQGRERVFVRRPERPSPAAFVTVLLDISDSMIDERSAAGHTLLEEAKRATALISAACEHAGTHMRVIPFNGQPLTPTSSLHAGHERLRAWLAGLSARGGTTLAPALRAALGLSSRAPAPPIPAGGQHVVALLSDGQLWDTDAEQSAEAYRRGLGQNARTLVIPFLLGAATTSTHGALPAQAYRTVFGRYAAVHDATDLPGQVRRWLQRARR